MNYEKIGLYKLLTPIRKKIKNKIMSLSRLCIKIRINIIHNLFLSNEILDFLKIYDYVIITKEIDRLK